MSVIQYRQYIFKNPSPNLVSSVEYPVFTFSLFLFLCYLWPPCVAAADIIFLPCGLYHSVYLSIFSSSPNLSGRRLDVYHTSTHGVALVRI